jgi:hypothetical protein
MGQETDWEAQRLCDSLNIGQRVRHIETEPEHCQARIAVPIRVL